MDNLDPSSFSQQALQAGNAAELEQKILFVLSALQDANQALDQCDRFVGRKISVNKKAIRLNTTDDQEDNQLSPVSQTSVARMSPGAGESSSKASTSLTTVVTNEEATKRIKKAKSMPAQEKHKPTTSTCEANRRKATNVDFTAIMPGKTSRDRRLRLRSSDRRGPQDHQTVAEHHPHRCELHFGADDVSKLMKQFQGNNEMQWKNVRKFIRQVLKSELEQEKVTRRATESLNAKLARQNSYLQAKLEEKRLEQAKKDEAIKQLKKTYLAKLKALQSHHQHLLQNHSQGASQKLSRLYTELERIQADLHKEYQELASAEAAEKLSANVRHEQVLESNEFFQNPVASSAPCREQPNNNHWPLSRLEEKESSQNVNHVSRTRQPNDILLQFSPAFDNGEEAYDSAMRAHQRQEEILRQYYPIIMDYRRLLESYLVTIEVENREAISNHDQMRLPQSLTQVSHTQHSAMHFANDHSHKSDESDDLLALFIRDCTEALPLL